MAKTYAVQKKGLLVAEVEAALVKHIRAAGGLSRTELAKTLSLAPSTVGVYVDRLMGEGVLLEGAKDSVAGTGRPRTIVQLNPNAGQFVGVDFHATEILAVSVDFAHNIVKQAQRPIRRKDRADTVMQKLLEAVEDVAPLGQAPLLGIGIGSPGPVDVEHGIALEYPYIRGFHDVPIATYVRSRFGVPIYIENTTNTMALAELWFGQGRGLTSFVSLWVRSGIGAGIVINRSLYSGVADAAGEIGVWLCPRYDRDTSGEITIQKASELQELQELASVRAICAALPGAWSATRLGKAYSAHDPVVREAVDCAAGSLGWAIAQLACCLAPEQVIVAGPLADLGADFAAILTKTTAACMAHTRLQVPTVTLSTLGPFSGALGAAALGVDQWRPDRG